MENNNSQNIPNSGKSSDKLRLSTEMVLNEDEIFACLKHKEHLKKRGRMTVQTIILLLMAAYLIIGFFVGEMQNSSSLMLATASLFMLAVMWFVPSWQLRMQARTMAENEMPVRLTVYDGTVVCEGDKTLSICANSECKAWQYSDLLILEREDEHIAVPRRITGDKEFNKIKDTFGLK